MRFRTYCIVLLALCFAAIGCQSAKIIRPKAAEKKEDVNPILRISALYPAQPERPAFARIFVKNTPKQDVLYRFELYYYLPRSANPRGKRVAIWPEINPGKPIPENPLYKPALNAFQLDLPLDTPLTESVYLLELTEVKDNRIGQSHLLAISVKSSERS